MATTKKKSESKPKTDEIVVPETAKYINTRQGNTFTSKGRLVSMDTIILPVSEGGSNPALKKV